MSKYPEHEKQRAIVDKSQAIGEFLEWLPSTGIVFGKWDAEGRDRMWATRIDIEKLLAEYFEIDLEKIEEEKRQMIDEMRAAS